ncbi:helix-turn-helix transcriptional regulator [Tardiphaga sp. 42S5]|uniref:AraC family transcriptional regulator n=1 Tax=Tardiphaga sp. 42S5 TaxID=1404799 RepID=UPI002A59B194|nr:helix-turn-helix transcriptional regulator [Tardiphaga sp. 42S5]WPO43227.1 helix-turn-helix transcriptional regulator [Tardiphaga sp. 42S5]
MPLVDALSTFDPDQISRAVVVSRFDASLSSWTQPAHEHRKGQLLYMARGVVTCETPDDAWVIPGQSAIWIPPGVAHRSSGSGSMESYCLFVEEECAATMPRSCCLVAVCPLFQELLRRAARQPAATDDFGRESRLAGVIIDELTTAPTQHMSLPMPTDPRLRRIAEAVISDPSDKATVAQWASRVGLGERTLCRLLQQETGMSFGRWRRQLHVLVGLRRLRAGQTVQAVAVDLGYESASGFTAMFRKTVGKPPARYFADRYGAVAPTA